MIHRRTLIQSAVALTSGITAVRSDTTQGVPNSTGLGRPKLKAPAHACDCHMHIYDPERFAFALSPRVAPRNATVSEYRLLQKRLGTTRAIIVTPRPYRTDNRATVDAIVQLGDDARGVVVLHPAVTNIELSTLHQAGVRGIRFSLGDSASAVVTPAMIEPLAKRITEFGWHVQFNMSGAQIVELAPVLIRLPSNGVRSHGEPTAASRQPYDDSVRFVAVNDWTKILVPAEHR